MIDEKAYNKAMKEYDDWYYKQAGSYGDQNEKFVITRIENPATEVVGGGKRNSHSYKAKYRARGPFSLKKKIFSRTKKK